MAELTFPDVNGFTSADQVNLWSANPQAMPFNYLQQSQLRRGQRQYQQQYGDALQQQVALAQAEGQREALKNTADFIGTMRDRDPTATYMGQVLSRQMAPGVFPDLSSDEIGLLQQEAEGFAAAPNARNIAQLGSGMANMAQAGLVQSGGASVQDLLSGDPSAFDWGVTPGAALAAASGGGSGGGVTITAGNVLGEDGIYREFRGKDANALNAAIQATNPIVSGSSTMPGVDLRAEGQLGAQPPQVQATINQVRGEGQVIEVYPNTANPDEVIAEVQEPDGSTTFTAINRHTGAVTLQANDSAAAP